MSNRSISVTPEQLLDQITAKLEAQGFEEHKKPGEAVGELSTLIKTMGWHNSAPGPKKRQSSLG